MANLKSLYDRKCTRCPLHETDGVVCVSGAGNIKNPRVLVVGDSPSKDEMVRYNRAYTDQRGQLLQTALEESGIPIGEDGVVFATYVCKCFPQGKVKPKDAKTCSEEFLVKEVFQFKPELILLLGKTAQMAVLHNTAPLTKTHGKVFDATFELAGETFTTKAMPIEHPFSIIQSPPKLDPWLADLRRARSVLYADGEPFWTEDKLNRFDFRVIETVSQFKEAARSLINNHRDDYLALDIEASGLDHDMMLPGFKVYTVQFGPVSLTDPKANYKLPVYILPLQSDYFAVSSPEYQKVWLEKILPLLNKLFSIFKIIAHNGKYDLKGLRRVGVNDVLLHWDTMMLWANLHGEAPMSLKEIAYQVTDLGGYDKMMEEYFKEYGTYDAPPEILVPYGGLDVVVTRHLMDELERSVLKETT